MGITYFSRYQSIVSMRFLVIALPVLFLLGSCTHESGTMGIDLELYGKAQNTVGFTWFANSNTLLDKSAGSGHSNPKLRTRFNEIATQMLDSNGRVVSNAKFAEESVIVKELFDADNKLARYAVLYKDSNNEFADAQGWVWDYINVDGSVSETAENKGKACMGCHQQTGSIDYILMNKFFP